MILDCSTVVPSLSGSEFFGHERGAFTGAIAPRTGAFELADGGTLFLDEVGELPVPLQAELLRAVQERTFKRVGSNVWRQASFRLLCATNRNLLQEQEEGRFRGDFYYRIAGWTVRLPSLSERTEDILPLFGHFYRQLRPGEPSPVLDRAVSYGMDLYDALKVGLVSIDSTMRSNLSVGLPIDLMVVRRDTCTAELIYRIEPGEPYFSDLRERWSAALRAAHIGIPRPPYSNRA